MNKLCICLFISLVATSISGCGGFITKWGDKFEGAGDYRVHSTAKGTDNKAETWEGKYVKGVSTTFEENDYISVSLKRAYIETFTEGYIKRKANDIAGSIGQPSPVRGQIAIVANVIEKKDGVETGTSNSKGRVIFYSDDVYEGQPINESFAPVYGPVRWGGNPVTIELTVMELDQEDNEQIRQILDTAASIGTDLDNIGSAKLIGGLNRIGDAFLTSNADDIMGKYKATFVPSTATPDYNLPILRHGDVIFTRKGDRTVPIDWQKHCYNEVEGLVQKRPRDDAGRLAGTIICNDRTGHDPEFSYFVMTIGKNLGTVDLTPELNFEQLQEQIKTSGSIQAIKTSVRKFASTVARDLTFRRVAMSIEELSQPKAAIATRKLESKVVAEALQCSYLAALTKSDSDIDIIKKHCGDDYADSSLSQGEFKYFVKRLVLLKSCLDPDQLNDQAMEDNMTEAGLKNAKATLTTQLSTCTAS